MYPKFNLRGLIYLEQELHYNDYSKSNIPVLSIFIAYWLGKHEDSATYERRQLEKAYNTFYMPFLFLFFKYELWKVEYSDLPTPAQEEIFNLITANIGFMNANSLEHVSKFIRNYYNIQEYKNGTYDKNIPEHLVGAGAGFANMAMSELIPILINQSILLSSKIHMPQAGKYALQIWSESDLKPQ